MREKYQVLVLPYRNTDAGIRYAIFHRSGSDCWQFIAGGGETEDGTPLVSARREAFEEAGIAPTATFTALETCCSIATEHFPAARQAWGETCLVIPEYTFAVAAPHCKLSLSHEHLQYAWLDYATAYQRLTYDSNRVALWELDQKLRLGLLP